MDLHLGELEQLVLLALARLDDNAYGVTVRQALLEGTGRDITLGTVHKTPWRLEQKKFRFMLDRRSYAGTRRAPKENV